MEAQIETGKTVDKQHIAINKTITKRIVTSHKKGKIKKALLKRHKDVLAFIVPFIDKNDAILDLGTRDGLFLSLLKKNGYKKLTGIDISKEGIDLLNSIKDITGVVGNVENMTMFKNNSFDFVNSSHVFEHCKDSKRAIAEVFRVLKPGGLFMLEVPIQSKLRKVIGHFFLFTSGEEVKKLLKQGGFTILKELKYKKVKKDGRITKIYYRTMSRSLKE